METKVELLDLRQQLSEMAALEKKVNTLYEQRSIWDRRVIALRAAWRQEQEDAEKLEKRTLGNYILQVTGRLEERREQEHREAREAGAELAAAEAELGRITEELRTARGQLAQLRSKEKLYQALLEEKRLALRAADTGTGVRIRELEQKLSSLEDRKREIQEAMSVGNRARGTAMRILSELESADSWNTWDLMGGGGILTHAAKHGHLDEAQDLVGELRRDLGKFKTELADIRVAADLQVNAEGFLRFADWFFDGLFTDLAMREEISQSRDCIQRTREQISSVLDKLSQHKSIVEQEIKEAKRQLEALVMEYTT